MVVQWLILWTSTAGEHKFSPWSENMLCSMAKKKKERVRIGPISSAVREFNTPPAIADKRRDRNWQGHRKSEQKS